jgi:hypothetical protein
MIPDRTNYEIWLIDYLDGNLDTLQIEQLMSFLQENPDIKEELNEIEQYIIKPDSNSFLRKNNLKKSVSDISESQFEYLCIAASENDLSDQETAELEEIIAESPEKRKTYELIQKLKLVAPDVEYRRKFKLRKVTDVQRIVRFSAIVLSAAATIAIMILLYNISFRKNAGENPMVVIVSSKDSNSVVANPVKIAGNKAVEEGKLTKNTPLNIISSLQKTFSDEMNSFSKGSSIIDSSGGNSVIQPVIISKIEFKQNVNVVERSFAGTLVAINTSDIDITGAGQKPGFNEFIAKTFRDKIFKSNDPEKGQLKAYEIADAGITGLNKLLGWQMFLKKNKNEKGEVKSVYFSSKLLKFNAPVKRTEPLS